MTDMRKVEIVSPRLLDGNVEYFPGDVKTLPKAKADLWILHGWAKDPETGEQNERVPGANGPVDPAKVTAASK